MYRVGERVFITTDWCKGIPNRWLKMGIITQVMVAPSIQNPNRQDLELDFGHGDNRVFMYSNEVTRAKGQDKEFRDP